jgi:predicted acylesterase/phospholipase RssA
MGAWGRRLGIGPTGLGAALAALLPGGLVAQAPGPGLAMTVDPPDYRLEVFPRAHAPGQRPLVLALGGGAAKGIAHVGVLQRLQEEGLAIDGIAGTSIGACIGSLYASGYSGEAMEELLEKVDLGAILLDRQHRFPGETLWEQESELRTLLSFDFRPSTGFSFFPGSSAGLDLKRALQVLLCRGLVEAETSFDRLRVPFRAVSTNLQTGRADAPVRGDLPTVVRASMCVPGLFSPVLLGSHQHVDGMLVQNLPVETARTLSRDGVVMAVEVGGSLDTVRQNSILGIAFQSLDVSVEERTEISRRAADLLVRPATSRIPYLEFHQQVRAAVREGRNAFDEHLDELEGRLYGAEGQAQAPGGPLRVEAPEPLRTRLAALAASTLPAGSRQKRHYLRLLRRIHAAGLASRAGLRFDPEGPCLTAEPFPVLQRVELQAGAWASLADKELKAAGVREGEAFNPMALGRALDTFYLEATLQGHPLVNVKGTGFDPGTGTLRIQVGEVVPSQVLVTPGILSEGQTDYLRTLLKPFEGRSLDVIAFAKSCLLAEKRLGLEELHLDAAPAGNGGSAIQATPIPDERTTVVAAVAYESTWRTQGAVDVHANRFLGTDLGVGLSASTDRLWDRVALHLNRSIGRWPRLGVTLSLLDEQHHLFAQAGEAPFLLDPAVPAGSGRTLRERRAELGLGWRVGMEDRGLLALDLSRGWATFQPGLEGADLPRMDQVQVRWEWDSFDRILFPTEGFLVRTRFAQGWRDGKGPEPRSYRVAYLRARNLTRLGIWGSLEEDLEAGLGWDAPLARWYSVGGPSFLAGTPSSGYLTPNFAMGRVGLPLHVVNVFGVNVQVVPRVDAGYLGASQANRLRDAAFVKGAGVGLRSEIGRWFCEMDLGRWSSTQTSPSDRTRVNFLFGGHPFDLWGK